jgi:hypothetical protein
MAKPSLRLIHPGPRVLAGLRVTPTDTALSSVASGNTLQLTLRPYDQTGAIMWQSDAVTYTSSAPAIAEVSSRGVVTAATPGTAKITATLSAARSQPHAGSRNEVLFTPAQCNWGLRTVGSPTHPLRRSNTWRPGALEIRPNRPH